MNRVVSILQFLAALLFSLLSYSQSPPILVNPLDIPLKMSGNFGEIRSNHFHSGIDFKTEGKEGLKVIAVSDGYVSRIKVSPFGFGKALYIQHYNGLTSVYAHLRSFNTELNEYVLDQQYQKESFEIELFPEKSQFKVEAGEIVAYSGNTGGSSGPHLHFELRNSTNQFPINPSKKGIYAEDSRAPIVKNLFVYERSPESMSIMDSPAKRKELIALGRNNYKIADTLSVTGPVAFGIEAIDKANGSENRLGIYNIEFSVDGVTVYQKTMETFSFAESRYVNAHMDYCYKKTKGGRLMRLHKLPNDQLSVYHNLKENGIIQSLKRDSTYHGKVILTDDMNNKSFINFFFKRKTKHYSKPHTVEPVPGRKRFKAREDNHFVSSELILRLPADALYDDIEFIYEKIDGEKSSFSPIYKLHFSEIPLHKYCNLSIKPGTMNPDLYPKAIVLSKSGRSWRSAGGEYRNGLVRTKVRSFGTYTIGVDTIAPKIKPAFIDISPSGSASFRVSDDLSGITSYRCTLNGKWILLEYDPKRNRLRGDIPNEYLQDRNELSLIVRDKKGNTSNWSKSYGK